MLVVRGLCPAAEVRELRAHGEAITRPQVAGPSEAVAPPPPDQRWFAMLHRRFPLHERVALQPGILDVVQGLVGPDIMLMQTMAFLKPPGERGNGWHQDSWYLQTFPDSLCGAWIALDDCDEENGALVVAIGSQVEPIHSSEQQPHPDRVLRGMVPLRHAHNPDDELNELAAIAQRYPLQAVRARAGDAVFIHGHVLHTSLPNRSAARQRRAFVAHYANARAYSAWGASYSEGHPQHAAADPAWDGLTSASFVLARGRTHLPCGRRRFPSG
jgi:phytanoyl-CoA hydroxylase